MDFHIGEKKREVCCYISNLRSYPYFIPISGLEPFQFICANDIFEKERVALKGTSSLRVIIDIRLHRYIDLDDMHC